MLGLKEFMEFLGDVSLAFWDWQRGESFWGSLASYLVISVVFALVGVAIWGWWW